MDPDYYRELGRVEDDHWWFAGRRHILSRVISRLDLKKDARILDAGCGTGGNLKMLSRFGRLDAFEMDDYARGVAAARDVCAIADGRLPGDVEFSSSSYDVIALLDVLEHILDDVAALRETRSLLKPGGFLVVTVPAFQFLWSWHDEVNHHVRRYTRSGLIRAVEDAGLTVRHSTYFNTLLFVPIAAARLLSRALPRGQGRNALTVPPQPVNRALAGLFSSESSIVARRSLPFGVSILMVASA